MTDDIDDKEDDKSTHVDDNIFIQALSIQTLSDDHK